MKLTITVEVPDEDFTIREGVVVVSGWNEDGTAAIRVMGIEDTPVWTRAGLLDVALQGQRQIIHQMWGSA